ncbi:DNA primase [Microbacterium sp.]|uniref:DNA primase n=1 Tax=Microbacterium sp. TaxID=51671 RepID=UPI0039E6F4F8
MPRIRQADVDEVKARTNIADIIGERVALKSAGVGSLKGLCPFHDERSPSFHVRPQVGYYHCFGCGESGDVYSFLRAMDHLSFTEAVERLAARIGYTLHYEDGAAAPETSGRTRLYAAHTSAAAFFRAQLATPEAEAGRRFLGERGFDAGAAAHFGVGYAPRGWSGLTAAMRAEGYTEEELLAAGLVSAGQRGAYDRFRGRLVWPIRDVTGQTIGFGARRLYDDDKGPKYLNTPETAIYKKAQVLYGLDLAKKDISRAHRVVVVEGYTDVMACHLAGVATAVATCGTAFGSDHITVLRRIMGDDTAGGEVIFTFDPDAAGQKAALRAFGDEKRFAAQTYVAVAPDGLDPCDLRLERGDAAVRSIFETKAPMFEFVIDQRLAGFDLATVEGQVGALRSAAPIVADIRDRALRPGYTRVLARKLGLDLGEVRSAVERASRQTRPAAQAPHVPAPVDESAPEAPPRVTLASLPRTADTALERDALMGVLQYGHTVDPERIDPALALPMSTPALDAVREAVLAQPDRTRVGWAAAAVESTREPFRSLAVELLTATFPARTAADAEASTVDLCRRLQVRAIERDKARLLGDVQRLPPDSPEGRAVRVRLRDLDARIRDLVEDR